MATVRKTITLTDQQDDWIKEQVEAGDYTNGSEYIRDLIRREQERGPEIEVVRAALIEGERSGKAKEAARRSASTRVRSSANCVGRMAEFRLSPAAEREDLARRTATAVELVKNLYAEEVTKLNADATVESYLPVIASQRVKRKLRMRRRSAAQLDSRNSARKPARQRKKGRFSTLQRRCDWHTAAAQEH